MQNPKPYPYIKRATKTQVGKMKLGTGALEEHNYVHAPIVQHLNIRQVCKMVGVCTNMKNAKNVHKF